MCMVELNEPFALADPREGHYIFQKQILTRYTFGEVRFRRIVEGRLVGVATDSLVVSQTDIHTLTDTTSSWNQSVAAVTVCSSNLKERICVTISSLNKFTKFTEKI